MKLLKSLGLGLLALAMLAVPVVYAAGLFPNFPIVGGASYCSGTNSSGGCTTTVPAGPSAPLTGDETIPADTNRSQGTPPQTVLVKPGTLANFEQPVSSLTASSNTITPNLSSSRFFTSTLGAGAPGTTVAAPTNATEGQTWTLKLVQDSTGTRTVSWNSKYKWPSGTAPTLTTTASKADVFSCRYDGTDHFCATFGLNYTP